MKVLKNGGLPDWLFRMAQEETPAQASGDQAEASPEERRQTYTFGTCPESVILAAVREKAPGGYPMTIRSQGEWSAIAAAVNMGIDSHLEAVTERSRFDNSTGECLVHPEELPVLLRRSYELGGDDAWGLRSAILSTLDIEEV